MIKVFRWIRRVILSIVAGGATAFFVAIGFGVLNLYLAGRAYWSPMDPLIDWEPVGVHLSAADIVMLLASVLVGGFTFRAAKGEATRRGPAQPHVILSRKPSDHIESPSSLFVGENNNRGRGGGTPFLGRLNSCYDWGVFQVLKSYCLKIISTILHPSEWASVLARYSRF